MFNFTKKKTIIGIVGIVLSVVLAAVCGGFDVGGGIEKLTTGEKAVRFFLCSGMALAVGFLMLIPFDWKMFLTAFGVMEIIVTMQFIQAVNISLGMLFISILILGGFTFSFTAEYRNCKYRINGAVGVRQQRKEQKLIQEMEEVLAEDEEIKRSIKYVEKSVLLSSQMGSVYQVIKDEQGYYFHYIGTILTKPDFSKLITDFDNVSQYSHKKDYSISEADITSLKITLRNLVQFADFGTLKIKTGNNKTKRYGLINGMEEEELKSFFGEDIEINSKIKQDNIGEEEVDDSRKKVLNKLNLARYVFSIIGTAFFVIYTFYNSEKTDIAFTILAIAVCLAPCITYLVLQDYLTIRDVGRFAKEESGKLNIVFTVILFPVLFALKCLLTGYATEYYQLSKLFLYSLIPFAVLFIVFLLVCKEYKKFKSCILVFAIAMVAFCPSFIYKVNSAFDFKQPDAVACEIIDLSADTDKSGNITYRVVYRYDGRELKSEVDELTYSMLTVGGDVEVLRYRGLFGIQSVYLK